MTPEEIVERAAEVLDAIGALRNVTDATDEQATWINAPLEVVVDELVRAGLLPTEEETRRRYHVVNNRVTNTERRYVTPWEVTP